MVDKLAVLMENLEFGYNKNTPVINIPSLEIKKAEKVFIHGPSGSGKTTLLGLVTGILTPNQGVLKVLGKDLLKHTTRQRDAFRGEHLGYIFQMFNLIPYLNAFENIALICKMNSKRRQKLEGSLKDEILSLADRLSIRECLSRMVTSLSIGQQQRVAAARALLGAPDLMIADEPTSALDADNRENFIEILFDIAEKKLTTILFVSHDKSLASLFDRSLDLPAINKS